MSNPTSIDTAAPVVARHDANIDAPLSTIWRLHTDEQLAAVADRHHFRARRHGIRARELVYVDELRVHGHVDDLRGRRRRESSLGWNRRWHHRSARVGLP